MKPITASTMANNYSRIAITTTPRWFVLVVLLSILFPSNQNLSLAQPTFDECKIFLIASDTARDLTLNRQPEYIRFLNLVARTYLLNDNFDKFDSLPTVLQDNYNAFVGGDLNELDISAAGFGQPTTEENLKALRAFCDETARLVATLITQPPTLAPTALREETGSPTIEISNDQETTSSGGSTLLTGPSDELSELPVECRRGMFVSDIDHDGYLTPREYAAFINNYSSSSPYPHSMEFDKLPQELQSNFYRLADDGLMNIFGAVPNQWTQASKEQRSFLQLICYRTEDALEAAGGARTPPYYSNTNHTTTIETIQPNQTTVLTLAPRPHVDMTMLANATVPPTKFTSSQENKSDRKNGHSKRNIVAAAIGSTLIVLVGIYMARDKQSTFHVVVVQWCQNQRKRRTKRRVSPFHQDTSKKNECSPNSNLDDLESSTTEENTGFLEDFRVGNSLRALEEDDNDVENQNNNSSSSSSVYNFQPVRFNPDDFINARPPRYAAARFNPDDYIEPDEDEEEEEESSDNETPKLTMDEENSINANFQDYRFDHSERSCDDSSAMSLYCNSVADEKVPSVCAPSSSKKTMGFSKTSVAELNSEFSPARKQRPVNVMDQACRFGVIAQSESKLDLEGIPQKRSSTRSADKQETASVRSPFPNQSAHRMRPTKAKKTPLNPVTGPMQPAKGNTTTRPKKQPIHLQAEQGEMKTPKAANKKIKKLKKKPSVRSNNHSNSTGHTSSESSSESKGIQSPKSKKVPPPLKSAPRVVAPVGTMGVSDANDSDSNFTELYDAEESSTPSFAFSYGGKSYCIDSSQVSPKWNDNSNKSPSRMQSIDIATEQKLQRDSISESTSFLSDDFSEDGKELPRATREFAPPPFRRPNLIGRAGPPFQRPSLVRPNLPVDSRRVRKAVPKRAAAKFRQPKSDKMSTTNPVHSSASLIQESNSTCVSLSDGDSTYDGPDSNTSSTFTFPETSSTSTSIDTPEGDPIALIHYLVPIVLPSENDKISHMLEQYQGRERELVKTLKRLEIRMKARKSVGQAIEIPTPTLPIHPTSMPSKVPSSNEPKRVITGGPLDESSSSDQRQFIDLDISSSSNEASEDYSQDSTYYEDERSSSVGFSIDDNHDDGSLSIFSDLR